MMNISKEIADMINSMPYLLGGVKYTLVVTAESLFIGTLLGVFIALLRVYGSKVSKKIATYYCRIIRSLPLLVILFILFFLGTEVIDFSAFQAAIISLALHTSAYQSEVFRSAIGSIKRGQMEAGLALGMSKIQCILFVILPQALRISIPYWTNEASILLKDSSLAYVLGTAELMRRGEFISRRLNPLITYIVVGMMYFIMTFIFTRMMSVMEDKYKIPE